MIFPVLKDKLLLFWHWCSPSLLCVASCLFLTMFLSPQLLYPSDSRQCVLRPPTWHSSQGPQGVCARAFHYAAFVLTLRAPMALHMLALIAICLCLCFRLACACCSSICLLFSARLPIIRLCIWDCLHYFGWSEAETRVLADIVLGCLWERLIKSGIADISGPIPQ